MLSVVTCTVTAESLVCPRSPMIPTVSGAAPGSPAAGKVVKLCTPLVGLDGVGDPRAATLPVPVLVSPPHT